MVLVAAEWFERPTRAVNLLSRRSNIVFVTEKGRYAQCGLSHDNNALLQCIYCSTTFFLQIDPRAANVSH